MNKKVKYLEEETKYAIVVLGVIINKEGKILLTQRNEPQHPLWHKKWQLPGGGLKWEESPPQALAREIKEETGFSAEVISSETAMYFDHWSHQNGKKGITLLIAFKSVIIENDVNKDAVLDLETLNLKWVSTNEISKLDLLPGVSVLINSLSC